jgi:hypothetical protein
MIKPLKLSGYIWLNTLALHKIGKNFMQESMWCFGAIRMIIGRNLYWQDSQIECDGAIGDDVILANRWLWSGADHHTATGT